ncbi:hypothetical protein FFWV33_15915 [Flavobacterium faecale]|uniref:DUF429 domain-containing protein n=1 Tax=Flavobacterium faecale TaxID=1355330 RepID=A0A2S1LHD4_9FLAO|nr:hypothetical protein [Flavobacterium faecale]AWG22906.1 hypothetical protein FFWV33_15915 [Flavobacterium faecale]
MKKYYIGWDVGAWNCDKNKSSKDAIVIISPDDTIFYGKRNNIRDWLNTATTTKEIVTLFFNHCGLEYKDEEVILAIDTPLGFSEAFVKLLTKDTIAESIADFSSNPYLFRKTEQFLYEKGFKPLSAVNHMIGAQATKGIHFISKFAPIIESVGVVISQDKKLTVIETYPSANKQIEIPVELQSVHQDIQDAFICAAIARKFDNDRHLFYQPLNEINEKEGWIWFLR